MTVNYIGYGDPLNILMTPFGLRSDGGLTRYTQGYHSLESIK